MLFTSYQYFQFSLEFRIQLYLLFRFLNFLFNTIKIFQLQFCIDDIFIANRINGAFITQNIFIYETADHMNDCINFPDIGKEFISESFTFAGAFYQSCYINYFKLCWYNSVRF